MDGHRAGEGLDNALGDEDERPDEGDRQQDVERASGQVDPEVADRRGRLADQAAGQGDRDGDAGRGRDEVADGEPGHLGQVRHRGLAQVVLPVRIGVEADGRVVGKVGVDVAHARRPCLAERQVGLEPLLQVQGQDADEREDDDRDRIGGPTLLDGLVDAHDLVDTALDGPEDRREEDPLALHDVAHVAAERPGDEDGDGEEADGLEQA